MEEVVNMKKVLASLLCLCLLGGFTFVTGCQKAEEKKVSQAPAVTQAPAPEEKHAEEGKPAEAGEVTITGTISEEGIVADDGQVYSVAENDKGEQLMDLVDKKVRVIGTVEEREGKMMIEVTSYEVIQE